MIMIISVFISWIRGWTFTILLIAAFTVNMFSDNLGFLPIKNHMYGLNYEVERVPYNEESVNKTYEVGIAEVACKYILQKPMVGGVIVGARNRNHLNMYTNYE